MDNSTAARRTPLWMFPQAHYDAWKKYISAGKSCFTLDDAELDALGSATEFENEIKVERTRRARAAAEAAESRRSQAAAAPRRPAAPVADPAWTERLVDGFIKGMDGDMSAWDAAVAESPHTRINLDGLSALVVHSLFDINQRNHGRNRRLDAVEAEIAELRARPQLKHCGTWSGLESYPEASLVTSGGGLWLATAAPPLGERPGNGATSWKLIVKSGDAR